MRTVSFLTRNVTDAEVVDLVAAARELVELTGRAHRVTRLLHYAGYADDRSASRGMLVWLRAVNDGCLVVDGRDGASSAYRPFRDGEPYELLGAVRYTPASAVAARAEDDQIEALRAAREYVPGA